MVFYEAEAGRILNFVCTWLQVSWLTLNHRVCLWESATSVSRGCWSPFTGKCLPLPLPSAPIASSQKWRLSISQEMRWNKYPLPMLLMMSVIAHLLWVVLLRRQGHALTSCLLLLLYNVKWILIFRVLCLSCIWLVQHWIPTLFWKKTMLNDWLYLQQFYSQFIWFSLFSWNVWHQKILFKYKIRQSVSCVVDDTYTTHCFRTNMFNILNVH